MVASGSRWLTKATAASAARSIPIAFAVVKVIVDHSAAPWKLGEADGAKLAPALIALIRRAALAKRRRRPDMSRDMSR
ncbi:hypothetical protein WME79_38665 [Sorangium sp. So ce726]|uniref:hypothetical protein n=1 Tax=Sorangium sp. So ce726 TaxID=3133319 RepID=UPI003F5F1D5D